MHQKSERKCSKERNSKLSMPICTEKSRAEQLQRAQQKPKEAQPNVRMEDWVAIQDIHVASYWIQHSLLGVR